MKHKDKRINIQLVDDIPLDKLSMLNVIHDNVYVRIVDNVFRMKEYDEKKIKYFLGVPISSYIMLEWALFGTNTSDVYVYDDLCFNLPEVSRLCRSRGVKIRMVLNRIPSTFPIKGYWHSSPFFRPEDFDLLNLYVDVAEFDCYNEHGKYDFMKLNVYYKHWFIDHRWDENLNVLNLDLEIDFPNSSVPQDLSNFKVKCKHRCSASADNPCRKCLIYLEQGLFNQKNGLKYTRYSNE